jgi:hypothetical protein
MSEKVMALLLLLLIGIAGLVLTGTCPADTVGKTKPPKMVLDAGASGRRFLRASSTAAAMSSLCGEGTGGAGASVACVSPAHPCGRTPELRRSELASCALSIL